MNSFIRPSCARSIAAIEPSLFRPGSLNAAATPRRIWRTWHVRGSVGVRGAKTVSKKKVKELQQGVIQADPLPEIEDDRLSTYPQYPPLLQGVRANMAKYPNCLLMTRVGNFYEFYFEHAEECARLLNIKLASKSSPKHPAVPMAGFPFWQLDRNLKILVQDQNRYVAISEELRMAGNGKAKTGMPQFDRKVTRVISPGTLIDEKFLDPYSNNFLLSICIEPQPDESATPPDIGLAWIDLSTGDFFTQTAPMASLGTALARVGPREIVMDEQIADSVKAELQSLVGNHQDLITYHQTTSAFDSMSKWSIGTGEQISGHEEAQFSSLEKLAGHQLIDYLNTRLPGLQLQLQSPRKRNLDQYLAIDRHSLRGLEVLETSRDGLGKGSLFHAVRRTVTPGGSRLLRDRLTAPSGSIREIDERLDLVTLFFADEGLRESVVQLLRRTHDVQRLVQKFTLNKGDADDLISLAKAIQETVSIHSTLQEAAHESADDDSASLIQGLLAKFSLDGPSLLAHQIFRCIDEEGLAQLHHQEENESAEVAASAAEVVRSTSPEDMNILPKNARVKARLAENRFSDPDMHDAWIMRRTASETIAKLHEDLDVLKEEKSMLEQKLQQELNTNSLSLKWTPGLGYTVHVKSLAALNRGKGVVKDRFVPSTKNARSFYLTEWTGLGKKIDQARMYIRSEETRIFGELRQQVIRNIVALRRNAVVIDELDIATAFAGLASEEGWTRPVLTSTTNHNIVGGRHPTVKLGLEEQGRSFVSNDLNLNEHKQLWLVTGPNMAGKSTFLRQNALITILAQAGSYVPAQYAEIGLVDQIFSRVGAADDLFRDQSTFMVEMLETAAILKQATARSFVIMDEVGRGTTPQDGMAIAYGALHHLHNINKCRTLFATHFHTLADLTHDWPRLARYCTDITEGPSGSFTFQHKLRPGVNRQSHALKVARLAGIPHAALDAADSVLCRLHMEKNDRDTLTEPTSALLDAAAA
ncbi:hypothetical protein DV738_g5444, partial [Chaetothyriales sp. CBS 135597]